MSEFDRSEIIVDKAGGTSNADSVGLEATRVFAEESGFIVLSAPGGPEKVTDVLIKSYADEFLPTGSIAQNTIDWVTDRYITNAKDVGLQLNGRWIDGIGKRMQVHAGIGMEQLSFLGEMLQAEFFADWTGFNLIDYRHAPADMGSNPEAWSAFVDSFYKPGEPFVAAGNITRVLGSLTTMGRGGSDTSQLLFAEAIGADYARNLTDSGVKSADPRIVGSDIPDDVEHVYYDEACQSGQSGNGLVKPTALTVGQRADVPLEVRSTRDKNAPFTVIDNDLDRAEARTGKPITISLLKDVVTVRVHENGMALNPGRLSEYSKALAAEGVNIIDDVSGGSSSQRYIVDVGKADKAANAIASAVGPSRDVEIDDTASYVTVVGHGVENTAHEALQSLGQLDGVPNNWRLNIATLEHAVRVRVPKQLAEAAVRSLHSKLFEDQDQAGTSVS